jgi:MarR family transcriptional regulator, organic hydroperoxide resistance regulator
LSDAVPASRPASGGDLLASERRVLDTLDEQELDFRAMAAVSNLFRTSTAIRRHMERTVLAGDRLSWTSFVALWVLWVWGEMEGRELAAAVGISRPTASGVARTLEHRGLVRRRGDASDGRMVLFRLTSSGRRTIEALFPRFNAEEIAVVSDLDVDQQEALASMLRTVLRTVDPAAGRSRA